MKPPTIEPGRESAIRRNLHATLASRNREIYVRAINVLWDLHKRDRWIIKSAFLCQVAQALSDSVLSLDLIEEEENNRQVDDSDAIDEIDSFYDDQSVEQASRRSYEHLRAHGWFGEHAERVDGKIKTTLIMGQEARDLAEYVTRVEFSHERDESSCVYAVLAALEKASTDLKRAQMDERLDDPAIRRDVREGVFQAYLTAVERGDQLITRLRGASDDFRLREKELLDTDSTEKLEALMKTGYRKALFDKIMQPLRVDDGISRFAGQIAGNLEMWAFDPVVIKLLDEADSCGETEGTGGAASLWPMHLSSAKYTFTHDIIDAWNAVQALDGEFTQLLAKRYRSLMGGGGSSVASIEHMLTLASSRDPRRSAAALSATRHAAALPCDEGFCPSDVKIGNPKSRSKGRKRLGVDVDRGMEEKSYLANDCGEYDNAAARMAKRIGKAGGFLSTMDEPPKNKAERVDYMTAVLAAGRRNSPYVVLPIDDSERVETDSVSIPVIDFQIKEGQDGH